MFTEQLRDANDTFSVMKYIEFQNNFIRCQMKRNPHVGIHLIVAIYVN